MGYLAYLSRGFFISTRTEALNYPPDSGNPTVRERSEASINVAHGGTVNPPRNRKGGAGKPPPKSVRARVLSRSQRPQYSLAFLPERCMICYDLA